MSLKISFFPLHFVISLLLLVSSVIIFADTIYVYMSSNIYLNGFIIALFIFCMLWILGALSYYSRSAKVLNRLLSIISPSSGKTDVQKSRMKRQALYVASSITGTLIDSPVVSRILSTSIKSGRIDVSVPDAEAFVNVVNENGDRILGPSKFLTSLFTMLGLFGTFLGLLQTIDGVGRALGSLSNVANLDALAFIGMLSDPLQGMSVAFSSSLFGLVSAFFGNYGNFVATHKLSILTAKLKNFLTANSGVAAVDPDKIDAKDILVSLDESFNRLYSGLSERLDLVVEGVFAMSKAVVRTQERQEKLMRSILDSFASMEAMWAKLPQLTSYLKKIAGIGAELTAVLDSNKKEMMAFIDERVVAVLERIAVSSVDTADFTNDIARFSKDTLDASYEQNDIAKTAVGISGDILTTSGDILGTSGDILKTSNDIFNVSVDTLDMNNNIHNVSQDINRSVSDVANRVDRLTTTVVDVNHISSNILSNILSTSVDGVNVSMEIRGISDAILNKITGISYVDSIEQITSELIAGNNLSAALLDRVPEGAVSLLAANSGYNSVIVERLEGIHSLATTMLYQFSQGREQSTNAILSELSTSNNLLDNSLAQLGQISQLSSGILSSLSQNTNGLLNNMASSLSLNNSISQTTLEELSKLSQVVDVLTEGVGNNSLTLSAMLQEVGSIRDISESALSAIASELAEVIQNGAVLNSIAEDMNNATAQQVGLSKSMLDMTATSVDAVLTSLNYTQMATEATLTSAEATNNASAIVQEAAINVLEASQNISGMSLSVAQDISLLRDTFVQFDSRFHNILDEFQGNIAVIGEAANVAVNLERSISNMNELLYGVTPSLENLVLYTMNASDNIATVLNVLSDISERSEIIDMSVNSLTQNLVDSLQDIRMFLEEMRDYSSSLSEGMASNIENISFHVSETSSRDYEVVSNLRDLVGEFSDLKNNYAEQMFVVSNTLSQSLASIEDSFDYISRNTNEMGSLVDRVNDLVTQNSDAVYLQSNALEDIREEMIIMSAANQDFVNNIGGDLDSITSSVGHAVEDFIVKLDSLENIVSAQLSRLDNMSNNLDELGDYKDNFLSEISVNYREMNSMVSDLVRTFNETAENISDISDNIARQADSIEKQSLSLEDNANLSADVIDEMRRLSDSSRIIVDTAGNIQDIANSFLAIDGTLARFDKIIKDQDQDFSKFSARLSEDVSILSHVVTQLADMAEDNRTLPDIRFDIIKLADDVSHFVDRFEEFSDKTDSSASTNRELVDMINKVSHEVTDIKTSVAGSVSNAILSEMKNVNNNQEDMLYRLEDIITTLENNFSKSRDTNSDNVLELLYEIRDAYSGGNMRLDVIANAVDSLITEMLNSREVAQSILDIVAQLGNFKRN